MKEKKNLTKISTPEPTPEPRNNNLIAKTTRVRTEKSKHKISPLKTCYIFVIKMENEKQKEYLNIFRFHNPSFLEKDLHKVSLAKNKKNSKSG